MSARNFNHLIKKISDYLRDRNKTNNFGTCKKCSKNVYWSTTKVASHIRSGHCEGATEEEVQRFKEEFFYETPKHLIYRSSVEVTPRIVEYIKPESNGSSSAVITKRTYLNNDSNDSQHTKRQKLVIEEEYGSENIIEEHNEPQIMYEIEEAEEKVEEYYVGNEQQESQPKKSEELKSADTTKEEKFISAVYPQFKGRNKLELIDEILDLQRRNELLQNKVKTYEDTINKLL